MPTVVDTGSGQRTTTVSSCGVFSAFPAESSAPAVSFTGPVFTFTSVTSHSPDAATFATVSLTVTRLSVPLSLVVPPTIRWLPSLRT